MPFRVIYKNETIPENTLSKLSGDLAKLLTQQGISCGDIIFCRAETRFGTLLQWLACKKLGVVPLVVPSEFSADRAAGFSETVDIKLILETTGTLLHKITNVEAKKSAIFKSAPALSCIHMTSATTGNPKLVLRTAEQLEANVEKCIKRLNLTAEDVVMPIVPLYHSFGFISAMLVALRLNATLAIPDIIMPRNVIGTCNAAGATFLLGVPYFFGKMLNVNEKYSLNRGIRYIISSGGPMKKGLQDAFFKRFGIPLLQQYGTTETGGLTISDPGDEYNNVGRPLDGVRFITREKDGENLLYVSSPETTGSYIQKDGLKCLSRDYYKTGDTGFVGEDGKVFVNGRSDDVAVIAGKKVSKSLVAAAVRKIDGVRGVRITQNTDSALEELVCEYSCDREIENDVFVEHLRKYLPEYQIPGYFRRVDGLAKSWKTE